MLADHLSQGAPLPQVEMLSVILKDHFSAFYTMADNSPHYPHLEGIMEDLVFIQGALGNKMIPISESQSHHRIYLSEHHIYGSARLGMQKYLSEDIKYHYSMGDKEGQSVNTLMDDRPWYSFYGDDVFKATANGSVLDTSRIGSREFGVQSHLLGHRHYELTNHLGNVQATVLDRVSPVLDPLDNTVLGYHGDLSTAQDHYPFGMLMPGRYVSDTTRRCVMKNATVLVPYYQWELASDRGGLVEARIANPWDPNSIPVANLRRSSSPAQEPLYWYHMMEASTHPGGEVVIASLGDSGTVYEISLSGEPSGGVMGYYLVHCDTNQTHQPLGMNLVIPPDCYVEVRVRQYIDSVSESYYDALPWSVITASGQQQFMIPVDKGSVVAGGTTVLEMVFKTTSSGSFPVYSEEYPLRTFAAWEAFPYLGILTYYPKTYMTYVCEEGEDYRFGFNGIHKENEIAGIGNHYSALYGEYDPRIVYRWNTDPKPVAWESPYALFRDNPIIKVDPLLDDPSTDVTKNKDGTYTVVGGEADGDRNIYVQDDKGKRTGEVIGKSLTEYSFLNDDGNPVKGAIINSKDKSGINFLNDDIIGGNLSLIGYMSNATGGQKYDFKREGTIKGDANYNNPKYHYRGLPFEGITHFGNQNGNIATFASARDFGNVAAGFITGSKGLSWRASRLGFDALESYQRRAFSSEGQPTQRAERIGHGVGIKLHNYRQLRIQIRNAARPVPFGPK